MKSDNMPSLLRMPSLLFRQIALGQGEPNPSIERTSKGLRPLASAHVKR